MICSIKGGIDNTKNRFYADYTKKTRYIVQEAKFFRPGLISKKVAKRNFEIASSIIFAIHSRDEHHIPTHQ
jgi:hypothetical protein